MWKRIVYGLGFALFAISAVVILIERLELRGITHFGIGSSVELAVWMIVLIAVGSGLAIISRRM